jgi:MFS family permease
MPKSSVHARESQRGLDWLSFFVADIQTGFGPFAAVYLATEHWSPGDIGLVLGIGALASVASELPGGALVDAAARKRLLVGIGILLIAAGSLIFALWPSFVMVTIAEILHGLSTGIIKPSLAAFGLGIVGYDALSRRLGRNHRYASLGNALTAALMGLLGYFVSAQSVFYANALLCLPALYALTTIRKGDVDYARARSAGDAQQPRKSARKRDFLKNRQFQVFVASLLVFQIANSALGPLVSARLAYQQQAQPILTTAALVLVPQIITGVLATGVSGLADDWGRKPLLVVGYTIVFVRAVLFTLVSDPWVLIAVQALDGLSAAVIGVMTPLVVADLTRGTGRYNLAQGWAGTAIGIGGGVSTIIWGYVIEYLGYTTGFLILGAVALSAALLVAALMQETKPGKAKPALNSLGRFFQELLERSASRAKSLLVRKASPRRG